jgi:hypothetical protein
MLPSFFLALKSFPPFKAQPECLLQVTLLGHLRALCSFLFLKSRLVISILHSGSFLGICLFFAHFSGWTMNSGGRHGQQ